MIRCRRRMIAVVTLLTFIFCAVPTVQAQAKEAFRSAKIYSFTGDVSVKRGGDKKLAAFEGMRLEQGDTLLTGEDSSAVIQIDSDKTVEVDENTEITLDTLAGTEKESQTGVSVFFGNVVNSIKNKLTDGSSYETRTSTAVMGVRGTTYFVGQSVGEAQVMVSEGTVAVSPVVLQDKKAVDIEEEAEPVYIDKGNQYLYAADGHSKEAAPVNADSIMKLSPTVAKALVTDELLRNVTDLPQSFATADGLVGELSARHIEKKQQAQQQLEEKTAELAQQRAEEPAAFFEVPSNKLSGQESKLLVPQTAEAVKETAEQKSELKQKESEPPKAKEKAEAPVQNAPQESAKPDHVPKEEAPPSGGQTQNTKTEEKPSQGNGGSGNSGSSGHNPGDSNHDSGGNSKPPANPEISISDLRQERVFLISSERNVSQQLAGVAISWSQPEEVLSYQLEAKRPGGAFAPFSISYSKDGSVCRLNLPLSEKSSLNGMILKITPRTKNEYTAVASELKIDYDGSPAADGIVKLDKPQISEISSDRNGNYSLFYKTVKNVENETKYHVVIKAGENIIKEFDIISQYDSSPDWSEYLIEDAELSGELSVTMQALGDDFNIWSSDLETKTVNLPEPLPKWQLPEDISLNMQSGSWIVFWNQVRDDEGTEASGYEIKYEDDDGTHSISDGHLVQMSMLYHIFTCIGDLKSIGLRVLGDGINYQNSDWHYLNPEIQGLTLELLPPLEEELVNDLLPPEVPEEEVPEEEVPGEVKPGEVPETGEVLPDEGENSDSGEQEAEKPDDGEDGKEDSNTGESETESGSDGGIPEQPVPEIPESGEAIPEQTEGSGPEELKPDADIPETEETMPDEAELLEGSTE